MFRYQELPRDPDTGALRADFYARHRSPTFDFVGYGFRFVDGRTVEPLPPHVVARVGFALGDDIAFEPGSREAADAALAWCERSASPERVEALREAVAALFGDAPAEPQEPPQGSAQGVQSATVDPTGATEPPAAPSEVAAPPKPTTRDELASLTDEQIKALAFEMNLRDKRWGVAKLRDLIAQECDL